MGILNIFGKKKPKNNGKLVINDFSGIFVTVENKSNNIIFQGRLFASTPDNVEVHVSSLDNFRILDESYFVTIRGYSFENKKAIHIDGTMVKKNNSIVQIIDYTVNSTKNDREYYRQSVNVNGLVKSNQRNSSYESCKILDISIGGIKFQTKEEFTKSSILSIKSDILNDLVLKCEIKRVKNQGMNNTYSCKFINNDKNTETQLSKIISDIQIRSRRLGR